MAFAVADLLVRFRRDQVAAAAAVDEGAVALLAGEAPADPDGALRAQADAARPVILRAIADAEAEVASAVAVRYRWADAEGLDQVRRLVAERALYLLYGDVLSEDMQARRADAARELEALRSGRRVLTGADGAPVRTAEQATPPASFRAQPPIRELAGH